MYTSFLEAVWFKLAAMTTILSLDIVCEFVCNYIRCYLQVCVCVRVFCVYIYAYVCVCVCMIYVYVYFMHKCGFCMYLCIQEHI